MFVKIGSLGVRAAINVIKTTTGTDCYISYKHPSQIAHVLLLDATGSIIPKNIHQIDMRPGARGNLLVNKQVTIQFNISQLYLF
jgi:hypothetical protein